MCLDRLCDDHLEMQPRHGYKVFVRHCGIYDTPLWSSYPFAEKDIGVEWIEDYKEHILYTEDDPLLQEKYQTGFHYFLFLKDAQEYLRNFFGIWYGESIYFVVMYCEVDDIVAVGYQDNKRVNVCKRIKPLEVVSMYTAK